MATFDAVVDACARLLPELGYDRLTTNAVAERAGVGIGSLYEYFPGKDAIIAVVVERLVERVMTRLTTDLDAILAQGAVDGSTDGIERWIERIYDIVEAERALVAVLIEQVPYTRQLDSTRDLPEKLLAFSERGRKAAGLTLSQPTAALMLINNLVSTTILQVVLEPHAGATKGATKSEMISLLSSHVKGLLRAPKG